MNFGAHLDHHPFGLGGISRRGIAALHAGGYHW
jgi:hypothetical protein